ncbi:MAG: 30S ribosomal protein S27ae [Candidatus Woesearchaeota archaeon]
MAAKKPAEKKASSGGAKKEKKPYNIHKIYEVKGDKLERKNRFCPKCGPGVFLAMHKDRKTCGKCGYSEKITKKVE